MLLQRYLNKLGQLKSACIYRRWYVLAEKNMARSAFPSIMKESFAARHNGLSDQETVRMLSELGCDTKEEFLAGIFPKQILSKKAISLTDSVSGHEMKEILADFGRRNKVFRSFSGEGFHETITPAVIQNGLLQNPSWYTPYTPYQPEISQGRLESFFNFQTLVSELTGLPIANASLLDEASAAAEAMAMLFHSCTTKEHMKFLVSTGVHKKTLSCLRLRAEGLGVEIVNIDPGDSKELPNAFGLLFQSPDIEGSLGRDNDLVKAAHCKHIPIVCAADPLALVLLKSPGEIGCDVAIGSMQRFGVPMGYGGPHAAYFACSEKYKRLVPGRIVGLSKDSRGNLAYRLALQTREQHIRREKATSNICTSQALLANMSAMYALYHGPEGLSQIAGRVNESAVLLADSATRLGHKVKNKFFFDKIQIDLDTPTAEEYHKIAEGFGFNLERVNDYSFAISMGETASEGDLSVLSRILAKIGPKTDPEGSQTLSMLTEVDPSTEVYGIPDEMKRTIPLMQQEIFAKYHSETSLMRYMNGLARKDISLTDSMIPLGSCTMKLNSTTLMNVLGMPEFTDIHPSAPGWQTEGYATLLEELKEQIKQLTGLSNVCLQPKSGAQGEYLALSMMRKAAMEKGIGDDLVCIVPESAHGTNPASAKMAGMHIAKLKCKHDGRLNIEQLKEILKEDGERVVAMMITYPSTFGIFDESILEAVQLVKSHGAYVYLDGANMNAMLGYIRAADIGVYACHLNLHKTFCIPHGGGGPGAGPIAVSDELGKYIPGEGDKGVENVSGSDNGSASILPISWAYIRMMGLEGLKQATFQALLNANYMAHRLAPYYKILHKGARCAHEFIIDIRPFEPETGIVAMDVAKRLQDYGFHPPTLSWPIPNTLMIEPTESENLAELDRFIEAMIMIRREIGEIEEGRADRAVNVLKLAPHTAIDLVEWDRPYSRQKAVNPLNCPTMSGKLWPSVNRLDDLYGDQHLVTSRES